MSTKKEEVKATSVEETKVEEVVKPVETVVESTETEEQLETKKEDSKTEEEEEQVVTKEESQKLIVINNNSINKISFYDDANREVNTTDETLSEEIINNIKHSHVYNEVMSYKKQLVIKVETIIDEESRIEEYVFSNEKAKELLK